MGDGPRAVFSQRLSLDPMRVAGDAVQQPDASIADIPLAAGSFHRMYLRGAASRRGIPPGHLSGRLGRAMVRRRALIRQGRYRLEAEVLEGRGHLCGPPWKAVWAASYTNASAPKCATGFGRKTRFCSSIPMRMPAFEFAEQAYRPDASAVERLKQAGVLCFAKAPRLSLSKTSWEGLAELSRPQTTEGKDSVISGDMRVGNDTSHDGQGDFSEGIEPWPSCTLFVEKGL